MIPEDKELLLKDICARLHYGVKVLCLKDFNHKWYNLERVDIGDNEVYLTANPYGSYLNRYVGIEAVRPYLFPLSSMTEEQKRYINNRWGVNEDFDFEIDPNWGKYVVDLGDAIDFINWLIENHFDFNGLIPKDLAINATGLNIY